MKAMTQTSKPSDPAQALEMQVIEDDDLDAVSGGRNFSFLASSSHTSLSEAGEALKSVAQK
jgi:hypothetical protein